MSKGKNWRGRVYKPLKDESKKQLKHMIEEKGAPLSCKGLSEKNVKQGIRGKAYNYSFAYGVISRGKNLTSIFNAGKNGRGASRCRRRERLISVEELNSFMEGHHRVEEGAGHKAVQTISCEPSHLESNENK